MITRVEVRNYRCLQEVKLPLGPFHILVGPNGSGKSTFLDAFYFLRTFVADGLEAAFEERVRNPRDLFWARDPSAIIKLTIEAGIPTELRNAGRSCVRYEVSVGTADSPDLTPYIEETLYLISPGGLRQSRPTVQKRGTTATFLSETGLTSPQQFTSFSRQKSALGSVPPDDVEYPIANWFRNLLQAGVRRVALESARLRMASPRGKGRILQPDGTGLPWRIQELKDKHPSVFGDWIAHVRTAISNIEDIRVSLREDDGTAFLVFRYSDGLEAPSWVVSDGTLQLVSLTSLAYEPGFSGIYLIEEPENGVHPTNMQEIYDSLSSIYDSQVLVASHSPVFLSIAQKKELLCFTQSKAGATTIVPGDELPALEDWRGEVDLGSLFATGILGQ
jgi:predicted ATPase